MGEEDIRRQKLNVFNMKTLGATVVPVATGSRTLRDATNEAMRDWMGSSLTTHYTIGSVVGPHPFPMIVRDFQSVIGREAPAQCLDQVGRLPDAVVACVGGGSNAAGMFAPFIEDAEVELIGAEAGGRGLKAGEHAASLTQGRPGVLHGSFSYVLQDDDGQTSNVHSISAGLDYPGVGPEHSYWKDLGRVRYESITDRRGPRRLQRHRPARGDPAGPRVEPRPGPGVQGGPAPRARQGPASSASPAAATRTPTKSPGSAGNRFERRARRLSVPSAIGIDPVSRATAHLMTSFLPRSRLLPLP